MAKVVPIQMVLFQIQIININKNRVLLQIGPERVNDLLSLVI
jgi:hypothetical protein